MGDYSFAKDALDRARRHCAERTAIAEDFKRHANFDNPALTLELKRLEMDAACTEGCSISAGVSSMSAIFSNIRIATATLSTATPLPIYANSLNGKNHPAGHIIQVGDDYLILSELDWNL